MREVSHHDSLQLSHISDERSEENTPFSMNQVLSDPTQCFRCEYCDTTTISKYALKGHKDVNHTLNLPHTLEREEKKCHICSKYFTYTIEFKSHMINEHSFF